MNKISNYIKRYRFLYLLALTCLVCSCIVNLKTPLYAKQIVDDVIEKGNLDKLNHLLWMILILGTLRCILQYSKEFLFDYLSCIIAKDIRKKLFLHIQNLSVNFFDRTNTGEIMSRMKDDVNSIWEALGFVVMLIIEIIVHISIVFYCMFQLNAKLTLLPLAVMPIGAYFAIHMEKKLDSVYENISEENAILTTVAQENIAGVRTVKAFAKEKFEIKKFLSHNQKYYDLNMQQAKILVKYDPFFSFISKALPVAVVFLGGMEVIKGNMTLGALTAFVAYSNEIVWPMENIGWITNSASSAIAANKKINKIFAETAMIQEPKHPTKLEKVTGHITFDHVDFSIDDKVILKDINFDLKAGKTIGIMGATGTGKSSIINLLQRFYDVTGGEIRLDGVNIKDLSLGQLRGSISSVMQDVFLFSDSINENIKLGQRDSLNDEEVASAAKLAQADSFIEKMEDQYESIIGERGIGLSGGQKQRISIARALVKKAPILILDDSTSALDMETECQIQQALSKLDGLTKVIIAHRISAVRTADEIIILNDGKIVERGTHEELLQQKGYYYDTFIAQYGKQFLPEHLKKLA